ncbi:hypothetical protein DRE_03270 [Drechslerella stenobrocha 248]|uniref:JmjC domain-containing protein n=1 Tax=Drechslerella stenobrocha 248 TaxID=1043628 RepID=W7IF21_9PEZI|nr:hypothetical protein DRE_03270 [Drechslerella stenobrocha 248]
MQTSPSSPASALRHFLTNYADLNSTSGGPDILDEPPSPLEFLRIVSRNRPVIIRNAMTDWPAMGAGNGDRRWTTHYLKAQMGDAQVMVAETPFGNADSIVSHEGTEYFVKPHTQTHAFTPFMNSLLSTNSLANPPTVLYAQSQDSNLTHEYQSLSRDVPPSIPWASIAIDQAPDALNLWIGNHHSVSSLHKDPYENLYGVVLGTKVFTLINPFGVAAAQEKHVRAATYAKKEGDGGNAEFIVTPDQVDELEEREQSAIGWPSVDLDAYFALPEEERCAPLERISDADPFKWVKLSTPMRFEVHAGEMLYLPALWYHQVAQRVDDHEGVCVAVNYWYDMDFFGPFVSTANYVRQMTELTLEAEGQEGGNCPPTQG